MTYLEVDVNFTIEAINTALAELNQELFDKLFGAGNVATLELKVKEDAETNLLHKQTKS
jgi:trigger factor